MASFALITEGESDQAVLERLIYTIVEKNLDEDVDVTRLQPAADATERARLGLQKCFGGWGEVLKYCSDTQKLRDTLKYNDYIIIQLDTDICEEEAFNIPRTVGGVERPPIDIINDIESALRGAIDADLFQECQDKFIFAISVHSIECWFLPYLATQAAAKTATQSCHAKLQIIMNKLDRKLIKDFDCYEEISSCLKKYSEVMRHKSLCFSLERFVDRLDSIRAVEA